MSLRELESRVTKAEDKVSRRPEQLADSELIELLEEAGLGDRVSELVPEWYAAALLTNSGRCTRSTG